VVPDDVLKAVGHVAGDDDAAEDKDGVQIIAQTDFLADHFPDCTLFFFKIIGFTAWSSQREPAEIFTLLQTIFGCFDVLAKKLGVYQVETVGESYVAVTGLPKPQADHAVRMARFARECLYRVPTLLEEMSVDLGPDTAELQVRFGLHSGPVTAGVLKGASTRFQLFGKLLVDVWWIHESLLGFHYLFLIIIHSLLQVIP
jgi:class 3 adenylate cyclase